jgi:predicted RNA-binding protein with PIN domain
MKNDIRRIEKIVEDTETRVKEDSREFSRDMKQLKIDLDKKIKRALENPLTNMNR